MCLNDTHSLASHILVERCVCATFKNICVPWMHAFYVTPWGHDPSIVFLSSSTLRQFGFFRVWVAIGFKGTRKSSNVEKENVWFFRLMPKLSLWLAECFFQVYICFSFFTCGTLAYKMEPTLLKRLKLGFMYVYQFTLTLICYACS